MHKRTAPPLDLAQLIDRFAHAPAAPHLEPAVPSYSERVRRSRVESQAAFDAAMYDGAVV